MAGGLSRRELLNRLATAGVCLPFGSLASSVWPRGLGFSGAQDSSASAPQSPPASPPPAKYVLSPSDDAFLEELERANFLFFWEQANPDTGLVKDRCNVRANDNNFLEASPRQGSG